MALTPYQYQLGTSVIGRNTGITIQKIDIQPYNVNNQDFQVPRTDETRFGIDTLTAGSIIFTMSVLENSELESMSSLTGKHVPDDIFDLQDTQLPILAKNWKSKDVRMSWNAVLPLLCCTRDGTVRRIYGRPGKFAHAARYSDRELWIDCMGEFRRADTFAHNDIEYYVGGIDPNAGPVTAERGDGDADAWVRFLIVGPANHPIILYGDSSIELNMNIPDGLTVEVSSYPWQRRVYGSDGVNYRRKVIGATKYLDQINFPASYEMDVSWSATGTSPLSKVYFLWRECYNVI